MKDSTASEVALFAKMQKRMYVLSTNYREPVHSLLSITRMHRMSEMAEMPRMLTSWRCKYKHIQVFLMKKSHKFRNNLGSRRQQ